MAGRQRRQHLRISCGRSVNARHCCRIFGEQESLFIALRRNDVASRALLLCVRACTLRACAARRAGIPQCLLADVTIDETADGRIETSLWHGSQDGD